MQDMNPSYLLAIYLFILLLQFLSAIGNGFILLLFRRHAFPVIATIPPFSQKFTTAQKRFPPSDSCADRLRLGFCHHLHSIFVALPSVLVAHQAGLRWSSCGGTEHSADRSNEVEFVPQHGNCAWPTSGIFIRATVTIPLFPFFFLWYKGKILLLIEGISQWITVCSSIALFLISQIN